MNEEDRKKLYDAIVTIDHLGRLACFALDPGMNPKSEREMQCKIDELRALHEQALNERDAAHLELERLSLDLQEAIQANNQAGLRETDLRIECELLQESLRRERYGRADDFRELNASRKEVARLKEELKVARLKEELDKLSQSQRVELEELRQGCAAATQLVTQLTRERDAMREKIEVVCTLLQSKSTTVHRAWLLEILR